MLLSLSTVRLRLTTDVDRSAVFKLRKCDRLRSQYAMGNRYKTPALFIEGKYLERWGFPIGTKIAVECTDNQLVIKPASKKDHIEKKEIPQTYITRLFDKDFNQLDFIRWKGYLNVEAVINDCKKLYANPVFKAKLEETAQFKIESLDGTTVYSSDNSIFLKKQAAKNQALAVAEKNEYE